MAKNNIVVNFVSDSQGDLAVAEQGKKMNTNLSQKKVIKLLQESVGKGTFISSKIKKYYDGDTKYRYTLKEENGKKGSIVIYTSSKFHDENDVNIKELEAISQRGNAIKYWNRTKLAATCVLVPGIILGTIGVTGQAIGKFADKMLEESQNYSIQYVEELNKARAENGDRPIGWTEADQEKFEHDRQLAIEEERQNDISYQFGDYFEEEQEKGKTR